MFPILVALQPSSGLSKAPFAAMLSYRCLPSENRARRSSFLRAARHQTKEDERVYAKPRTQWQRCRRLNEGGSLVRLGGGAIRAPKIAKSCSRGNSGSALVSTWN